MSVTATATTPLVVTLDEVRGFLRDIAGAVPGTGVENIMFDLPEFSDDDIRRAIKFTTARFNLITPVSNDLAEMINPWLMLVGISEFLVTSEAFRQKRNQVTYAAGDVAPIGIDEKFQLYIAMADRCKAEFEEKAKLFKMSRNMHMAFGQLGSGYRFSSRFNI
jgi:hypothetical protein